MTATPLPDPALIVTRLRYDFLFCLDPGFWIAPSERNRRLTFTQSTEAERMALALRPDQRVRSVEWAQSVFEDAQRRDHATLTTINFDDIAPANIRLAEPLIERVGMFDLVLSDLRLSRDGPIAFPFVARFAPEGPVPGLPVDRLLRELLVVRESAYRLFSKAASSAFEILSGTDLFGPGDESLFKASLKRCHRFEIVDFDYCLSDGSKPTIQEIAEDPASAASRELAGLIRMARPEVWANYRPQFLADFFKRNLGNRADELWIFNSKCLVRHHPEEGERADVHLWFEDARMAVTILLQKVAALEFLHWVMKTDLGKVHGLLTTASSKMYMDAVDLLAVVEEMSNRVVDPLVVERHVSHEFFRRVLREAADSLELHRISGLCRDRLEDVRHLIQAVGAQVVSAATLESARSSEKVTRQMYWLSILVAILAAAQVAAVFR